MQNKNSSLDPVTGGQKWRHKPIDDELLITQVQRKNHKSNVVIDPKATKQLYAHRCLQRCCFDLCNALALQSVSGQKAVGKSGTYMHSTRRYGDASSAAWPGICLVGTRTTPHLFTRKVCRIYVTNKLLVYCCNYEACETRVADKCLLLGPQP